MNLKEGFVATVRPPAFLGHFSHDSAPRGVQVGHLEQIFAAVLGRPVIVVTVGGELVREAALRGLLFSALGELHGVALGESQFLVR